MLKNIGELVVTVTTKIITFVGDSYKPLFATVTGSGPHQNYINFNEHLPSMFQTGLLSDDVFAVKKIVIGNPNCPTPWSPLCFILEALMLMGHENTDAVQELRL